MTQTIDLSSEPETRTFRPRTWGEVAELFGTNPKTIERDRVSLGRFEDPISDDLLFWIRMMRSWCGLGGGGKSPFNRRRFMQHLLDGCLEEKLKRFGVLTQHERLPDFYP